jgi:hypothetical protein
MRQVEDILEPIMFALAADGAVLTVETVTDATLRLRLDTTDACAECVVGDEVLEAIVLGHLRSAGTESVGGIEHVEIEHAGQPSPDGGRG